MLLLEAVIMENYAFFVEKLGILIATDVSCYAYDQFWDIEKYVGFNPVRADSQIRNQIIEQTGRQEVPVIHIDEFGAVFACIRRKDAYFFLGPVRFLPMNLFERCRYFETYGGNPKTDQEVPVTTPTKFLLTVQLAAGFLLEREYDDDELISKNGLDKLMNPDYSDKQVQLSIEKEEEELYHHTYEEERRLLDCVREGKTKEALKLNLAMDDEVGRMSSNQTVQWKNLLIVGVTLCTRAAIEGGVSPAEAYRISDYYIEKSDQCRSATELIACRNRAIEDLADRVYKKQTGRRTSSYVEKCCDYVAKHYRDKIYLEEIAKALKISPYYLSRTFSKEMGLRLQDYITKVRIERAEDLLTYSDHSIAEISDYVNFPSQSYFGKVFKKYTQETPKQYRESHRPKEST